MLLLLEKAKKRISFHFKAEETMKEGEIKFSNACSIPLFENHHQIWEQNPECVSRGGNSSWEGAYEKMFGKRI